jgi:3-hydroxyacyl-CoA dehydrogenase
MDVVGLDVVLNIEEHYAEVRKGVPEAPRAFLKDFMKEYGRGIKDGRGFYDYSS